jgi:hypothetical protein
MKTQRQQSVHAAEAEPGNDRDRNQHGAGPIVIASEAKQSSLSKPCWIASSLRSSQ